MLHVKIDRRPSWICEWVVSWQKARCMETNTTVFFNQAAAATPLWHSLGPLSGRHI